MRNRRRKCQLSSQRTVRETAGSRVQRKSPAKSGGTAHLSDSLLRMYRALLQKKYSELSVVSRRSEEVLPEVGDDIDFARATIDREISHELTDAQRMIVEAITAALAKIDRGDFGICEACGKPISQERLKALPWARYCIVCQSSAERT